MNKYLPLSIIWILVLSIVASATTINIPADYSTIQAGIDAGSSGDTVLVQPDTYVENINFNGLNIVLGSLFLITGDTSYISTTIIDGDSSGTVVTFGGGEDSTALIIGFTIQNGYHGSGGGLRCLYASPKIINNLIIDNVSGNGGGIDLYNSNATIINNTISDNYALTRGGGIHCENSDASIENNIISGNEAVAAGGGIHCISSSPSISDNLISDNSTDYAGGIGCAVYSEPDIINNTIIGNTANFDGGGIFCYDSSPVINGNIISSNTATNRGGGIHCEMFSNPVINNNTIYGNSTSNTGGGIYVDSPASPSIQNTIFWANGSLMDIDGIYYGYELYLTYCNVQDTLWSGEGNISCDPMFCYPDTNNFYIDENSCCVGTGDGGVDIGALGVGCVPVTRNVPGEYGVIQAAIDASHSGDTVLVQPDTYVENINFNGKNVIVTSLFLVTEDTSFISSTIIDGDSSGTVVTFNGGEDSTAKITGLTIQNGSSPEGGGIACRHGSSPSITFNKIVNNIGTIGGGIYCYMECNPLIGNNTISGNQSHEGGGIYYDNQCVASIYNNAIIGNTADSAGGAINCRFGSSLSIADNMITGNIAGLGGGIYCVGSRAELNFNVINNNFATDGGGIYFYYALQADMANNTFYGNQASDEGGGIYSYDEYTIPTIINTIFWGNNAEFNGDQIYHVSNIPIITYCDIQDTLWPGDGNISCDPMFCDTLNNDYHLADTSGCVGAGEGGANIGAFGIGCGSGITPIYDIQFNNTDIGVEGCYPSPLDGMNVTTGGIVTNWRKEAGDNQQAVFFIQDPVDTFWEGLFIYDYGFALDPQISIGDSVSVQGQVAEFYGITSIINLIDVTILSSGYLRPAPLEMTIADFAISCDSVAEKYEGVLVSLNDIEILTDYGVNWWITDPNTTDSMVLSTVLVRGDPACVDNPPSTGVVYSSVTGNILWDSDVLAWMIAPGCDDFESGGGNEYLPGDANMPNGIWPPSVIGSDVTYLVNYFRAIGGPCLLDGFYASADANGDCLVIGSDVTKLVTYFRGLTSLSYCPDYEPAWPIPDDLPPDAPPGWPNCE